MWEIEQIRKEIKRLERKKELGGKEKKRLEKLERTNLAYEESGEIYHTEEEANKISLKKFREVFTNQRLNLLKEISEKQFESISEISRYLGRDIKNIYSDLKVLEKFNLIKLEKEGKMVKPKVIVEAITLEFFND